MFWLLDLPNLSRWLGKCGVSVVPDSIWQARRRLDQWALRIVDTTEEAMTSIPPDAWSSGDFPVVYNQLKLAMARERDEKGLDPAQNPPTDERLQLASECLDHLVKSSLIPADTVGWLTLTRIATRDVFGKRDLRPESTSLLTWTRYSIYVCYLRACSPSRRSAPTASGTHLFMQADDVASLQ